VAPLGQTEIDETELNSFSVVQKIGRLDVSVVEGELYNDVPRYFVFRVLSFARHR
jgi:hypothetical protein